MRAACSIAVVCLALAARADEPKGSPTARKALETCLAADGAPRAEQDALWARGLRLAEQAIAADDHDAVAHFAAFCNRGRQLERAGANVASLGKLRQLRRDVDRALEIAPDYEAALVGKGTLLLDEPRLLGGDAAEGERLLRRALALDPHDAGARLRLARALADRGARDDARSEGEQAAKDATGGDAEQARAFLDRLGR